MRLQLILPRVDPTTLKTPCVCPHKGCRGRYFRPRQQVIKRLRDTLYKEVKAYRYECLRCGRTFRVYPQGTSRAQSSQRLHGLAVMLYLLGLSYGAVSLALEALGVYLCKSQVYEVVQAVAERVPGLKRGAIFQGIQTPALGADITSVKCNGRWLALGLTVDDTNGLVLSIDELPGEDAETLQEWMEPIITAVGAQLLVSDDADSFKIVADEQGLTHQICKGHVKRSTEAMIEDLKPRAACDEDGSLSAIYVTPQQTVADLEWLGELIQTRRPQDVSALRILHLRYVGAAPPRSGERASVAYRLRMLFLDRWSLWSRLTRYRIWEGPQRQTIDGTNNNAERAIGWWIKERYRTMRGYKRPQSAVNVSRLLAWAGNHLDNGGADLSLLIA
jgi:hypothetical protein